MTTMPPSSSPHVPPGLSEDDGRPVNDVSRLFEWLNLRESSSTDVNEVAGALQRRLRLSQGNSDSEELAKLLVDLAIRSDDNTQAKPGEDTSPACSSTKENDGTASSANCPTSSVGVRNESRSPFSARTDGTTPVDPTLPKPATDDRGRSASRFGIPRGSSRSRTPQRSMFRARSSTPSRTRSPSPVRQRSPSPLRRFFTRSNSKANVDHADTPTASSGLPPTTPVRPAVAEASSNTPAASSTASSVPSPPPSDGKAFLSPEATMTGVPTGSVSPKRTEQLNGCPTGMGKMRRKTATPAGMTAAAADATTMPDSTSFFAMPAPLFHVGSSAKYKSQRGRNRRRNKHRTVPTTASAATSGAIPGIFPVTAPAPTPAFAQPSAFSQQSFSAVPVFSPTSSGSPTVTSPSFGSQMDIDQGTPMDQSTPPAPNMGFSIGSGGKSTPGLKNRSRKNPRKVTSPNLSFRRSVRTQQQASQPKTSLFSPDGSTSLNKEGSHTNPASGIHASISRDSVDSSGGNTVRTASTSNSDVDYSGARAMVASLRDEARAFYTQRDYRNAVLKYSNALRVHRQASYSSQSSVDDLRAVLLGNRSAALFMVDAHAAAAGDCKDALHFVSDTGLPEAAQSTEGGPALKAKLLVRMGKSLLKLGTLPEAEQAFSNAVDVAQSAISSSSEGNNQVLNQLMTEAEAGRIEISRCDENIQRALKGDSPLSTKNTTPTSRRSSMQSLLCLNTALRFAPDSVTLIEKKVTLLAMLKRWRELAGYCERLAAKTVKSDGLFEGDLAHRNPLPGIPQAKHLRSDFFDDAGAAESSIKKLTTKAAGEAALRLPVEVAPLYIRALRLEERYPMAAESISALEGVLRHAPAEYQSRLSWIAGENDKLSRTIAGKDRGDALFRNGDYQLAAAQYTSCLSIDAEGLAGKSSKDSTSAGGRVHAVLHCNRAACLMALKKFQEAVTDCTAALRIHSLYMKAMLRRARCYARLERHQESIDEYKRWIELVEEARKAPEVSSTVVTPCLFDTPKDVLDRDYVQVKQELADVCRAKRTAENTARREAAHDEDRRQWFSEQYGRADPSDAQRRREQWYSQQGSTGSRRWDSFSGKSPNKGSFRKNNGSQPKSNQRQENYSYRREEQRSSSRRGEGGHSQQQQSGQQNQKAGPVISPALDTRTDHYTVLGIPRNATDADIKKAYRKMALKYHPDKNKDASAPDLFRRVKLAYETLNDASSRRKYDAEIRFGFRM